MLGRLLAATLLTVALASAQHGGDNGNEGGRAMRQRGPSKFDQFAEKLKLNSDQKIEARTIIMDAAKETAPLQQQLMKAREVLANAFIIADNEQAGQVLAQYTALTTQLAAAEARSFARICAMLKPGQHAKAGPCFELLAAIYEPTTNQGHGKRGER